MIHPHSWAFYAGWRAARALPLVVGLGLAAIGCEDRANPDAVPTSSALAPAKPNTAEAMTFVVDTDSSRANFSMDAPFEKIHGEADDSISGEIFVDLTDLPKSNGLVKIDLDRLVLAQQRRPDEKSEYAEKKVNPTQNKHMKDWLEIADDAPAEVREKHRYVEYKIKGVVVEGGQKSVASMTGAERKLTLVLTADVRLHERTTEHQTKVEVTFHYEGDTPKSLTVKSLEPIEINLDKHDVRPREAFGKLAQKTLGDLLDKVASEAPVDISLSAKAKSK